MSEIEGRTRAAARRFQDDVADTVDLDLAYERARSGRAPSRALGVLATAAVVALVATVFVFRPDNGDVEVAVDEDEPTSTTEAPSEITLPDGVRPITLGAPDDGKDSIGLPVTADPATGLVDGQSITVTGSGFPPGEQVGVVMCAREAGGDHGGRGVDACNIGHFAQGVSDQDGVATVQFSVRRLVILDGQEIDCASEPGRCILGMGMLSDYDQSGGFAIDFDPSAPAPEAPTVTLSDNTDIADGEVVMATITGLYPQSLFFVEQCAADGEMRCTTVAQMTSDADGSFEGGIRLWRNFGAWYSPGTDESPNIDCARQPCTLRFGAETPGGRLVPDVDLSFDPDRGSRVAPTMQLAEPGPYREEDTITVHLEGHDGSHAELLVCAPAAVESHGGCVPFGASDIDGTGTFSFRADFESMGISNPCVEGCTLTASVYPDDAGPELEGPPALFPEPIPITITP